VLLDGFILKLKLIIRWASAGFIFEANEKVTGGNDFHHSLGRILKALSVFFFLLFIPWISQSKLIVGNIGIDVGFL
jgi:hypothetical protein